MKGKRVKFFTGQSVSTVEEKLNEFLKTQYIQEFDLKIATAEHLFVAAIIYEK